ncbi:hypothetical protein NHF46_03360 [Arthrobacter alpinus]|nr:hypothetical protein [Arthrobacter alpinus]
MTKKTRNILIVVAIALAVVWALWATFGSNDGVSQKISATRSLIRP